MSNHQTNVDRLAVALSVLMTEMCSYSLPHIEQYEPFVDNLKKLQDPLNEIVVALGNDPISVLLDMSPIDEDEMYEAGDVEDYLRSAISAAVGLSATISLAIDSVYDISIDTKQLFYAYVRELQIKSRVVLVRLG